MTIKDTHLTTGRVLFLCMPVVGVIGNLYHLRHYIAPKRFPRPMDTHTPTAKERALDCRATYGAGLFKNVDKDLKKDRIFLTCGIISSLFTLIVVLALTFVLAKGGLAKLALLAPGLPLCYFAWKLHEHKKDYPDLFSN